LECKRLLRTIYLRGGADFDDHDLRRSTTEGRRRAR
jgi:hypothetical protein